MCLGAGDEVLVYGGLNISWKVLSDMWVLDVYSGRWREVCIGVIVWVDMQWISHVLHVLGA